MSERLEKLKRYYSSIESLTPDLQEDIPWLIEQAERVKELEEYNEVAYNRIVKVEEQNQRYKQALEFYANKKTYELGVTISMGSAFPRHEPIKYDKGEKARQALEADAQ